jgi:hypothetical protein
VVPKDFGASCSLYRPTAFLRLGDVKNRQLDDMTVPVHTQSAVDRVLDPLSRPIVCSQKPEQENSCSQIWLGNERTPAAKSRGWIDRLRTADGC